MNRRSQKRTAIAGVALIVLVNAVILGGAAWNRSGEPDAVVTLTERELGLPYQWGPERENSGISLQLRWSVLPQDVTQYDTWETTVPAWLDATRLEALGFPVAGATASPEAERRFNKGLPRSAFVVLEYDGPAYRAMLTRVKTHAARRQALALQHPDDKGIADEAKAAEQRSSHLEFAATRLYAVDAGLDPAALRHRYPDRSRYLIAPGSIRAQVHHGKDGVPTLEAYVDDLAVERIHLPFAYRRVLEPLLDRPQRDREEDTPRYTLSLAYGRRYEPWIVSVERNLSP